MVKDKAYYDSLTELIIGCAYKVGNVLGAGFLEKVYERALAHELQKAGLKIGFQQPIQVHYDGVIVGDFFADLIVNDEIIVELKSAKGIDDAHLAQCLNYLIATNLKLGLLINFGTSRVQVRRVVNNFMPKNAEARLASGES